MYYIKLNILKRSLKSFYSFEVVKYRQTHLNASSHEILYIY